MSESHEENSPSGRENNYFDGLEVTGTHKIVFFIIMLAYFFEQMDNWNFGFIAPAIFHSWGIQQEESNRAMSLIVFWYFIGMTAGGFLGGVISDFIGRRKTFLCAIVLFSVCSVINGLPIDNLPLFIMARSLTGFGVFCLMVCSQAYIAEMAPAETRGKWQGLVAAVGFCAVPVIAFICRLVVPLSPDAWRWIFYFGGIGLVGFVLAAKYLKESPRWLVSRGRVDEAEEVVRAITGQTISLRVAARNVSERARVMDVLGGMFSRKYIGRTGLLCLTFFTITPAAFIFTSWTGKLLATIPVIDQLTGQAVMNAAGQPMMLYDQATMLTIMTVISCGVPAGCYLASLISDLGGRKIPLAVMFAFASAAAFCFTLVSTNVVAVGIAGFFLSVANMCGGFILFSYTAESYPTHMRNTAVGTHNGAARLTVSGFQLLIPVILAVFGGTVGLVNKDIPAVFTTIAILFAIPVPFILLFGKRTGGKSLEEIS